MDFHLDLIKQAWLYQNLVTWCGWTSGLIQTRLSPLGVSKSYRWQSSAQILQVPAKQLRLSCRNLQWNIERGYKLEEIVKELKNIDADVIALQEVDIGCERSMSIDTGIWPTTTNRALTHTPLNGTLPALMLNT